MPLPTNAVQAQVELSNLALLMTKSIISVVQAAFEDNVQPQVALASEALGQRLLVSKQVIQISQELFNPSQGKLTREVMVDKLKVVIGLPEFSWHDAMKALDFIHPVLEGISRLSHLT